MNQEQLIDQLRLWVGTPFVHQGRMPLVGLDCAGLVVCLANTAQFKAKDVSGYSREPDGKSFRAELERQLIPVKGEWKPLDILLLKYVKDPRHLAVWTGSRIIHADNLHGEVVEHRIDNKWIRKIIAVYRFPELAA